MKKRSLTALVLAFTLALTVTAFAAEYDLPVNGHTQESLGAQWITPGVDGIEDGVPPEVFASSTAIVFEMPEPSEGFMMIAFGAGNSWAWTEYPGLSQYYADGKLTVNWSTIGVDAANLGGEDDALKVLAGDWGVDWADHGITRVYLVTPDAAPAAVAEVDNTAAGGGDVPAPAPAANPATGESSVIFLAGAVLLLAAGSLIFILRKSRAN